MRCNLNNKGAILIYLLILISILFFLIFHGIFYSKLNYKLSINYVETHRDFEKIKYITYIVGEIIKNQNLYNDFFEDGFFEYYKKPELFKVNNKKYYIKLEKEADKINLNTDNDNKIKEKILQSFEDEFNYQYLDSISDKILDWRDKDDYVRLHGAEKEDYKNYGYLPKNGNFSSLFELLYVKDMKNNLFFKYDRKSREIKGLLTIFTIYPKSSFRMYLWDNNRLYVVFFAITGNDIKIFNWKKLV